MDTPSSISSAQIMLFTFSFSLKRTGSIKVTNRGKVEKVMVPTATLATCTDCIKVVQWRAIIMPAAIYAQKSPRLCSFMGVLVHLITINKVMEEKNKKINKYTVGTVMEGTVEQLKDYGAFVNIGDGISGLVHLYISVWAMLYDKRIIVYAGFFIHSFKEKTGGILHIHKKIKKF